MNLQEKILQIEQRIEKIEKNKTIVIWCAGVHTEKLFKYTSLLTFPNLEIVDNDKNGMFLFGRKVHSKESIHWNLVDYVVISSFKYQNEILQQLSNDIKYKGEVITLYDQNDKSEFYNLNSCDAELKWSGCYPTWLSAQQDAKGYEDKNILKKVYMATKKVADTSFGFERDSVFFEYDEFSWLILTFIAFCAIRKSRVVVADFGGSLGSLFWKNRKLFYEMDNIEIEWDVIEQKHFVDCGKKNFNEEKGINYYYALSELKEKPDIILFSGVLQYINEYEQIIQTAVELDPKYIIIDRTYFSEKEKICVQYVPKAICESSYPVRFLEKNKILKLFNKSYNLLVDGLVNGIRKNFYADGEVFFEGFMIFKSIRY